MIARRSFITLLGGAAATWPVVARGQQPMPVIGLINSGVPAASAENVAGLHQGLKELGYARQQVAAIAAPTPPAALAAKRATQTIPIVFTSGSDPLQTGLVTSLHRPGGNVTGAYFLLTDLVAKRLALLRELLPQAKRIALLVNPMNASDSEPTVRHATAAARELGFEIEVFNASTAGEVRAIVAAFESRRPDALFIGPDPLFNAFAIMQTMVAFSLDQKLPISAFNRELVGAGCLMSYAPDIKDSYRQAGVYIGRILKGEKPGDLPVVQPTKYELVINLKTAKVLGLTIPSKLLFTADEIIE
jgi:putative ABC transport system substrate-binding protein